VADNLTIQIGADTSKLRGEIELVEAQIQNLRRLARGALRKDDAAGAAEYTQQIGRLRTNLVGLNQTLAETGVVAAKTSRSMAISARSFRSFDQAVLGIGRSLGGAQAGLIGFAAALAGRGIGQVISGVVEDLNKLQQTAANTALPAADVKAFQDIMAKAGIGTDAATSALTGFSKAVFDAQLKAGQFNKTQTFGVAVLKGAEGTTIGVTNAVQTMRGALTDGAAAGQKFVNVWRGGQDNTIKDLSEQFKLLGINVKAFPTTPTGLMDLSIAAARALQDTSRLNEQLRSQLGQQLFGPDWAKATQQLVAYANSPAWQQARDQAAALITPEAMQRLADYNTAWGTLQTTITTGLQELTIRYFPELNAAIAATPSAIQGFFTEISKTIETTKQEVQGLIDLWNWLGRTISAVGSAIGGALGAAGNTTPAMVPFAEGGMVAGPGTATSDSILARVSAGEYVMRARAVDHWGPRFMASLNALRSPFGFAGGGLVMPQRSLPRFADGGLVAAGAGGAPVHLHLGGHSFALSGSTGVVDALVVEARRQQVRSAGIKPSWYGGRPGGH
jgi:hypothetical protein